jgi:RNA polymerase sigma factor (sigma-70 family)
VSTASIPSPVAVEPNGSHFHLGEELTTGFAGRRIRWKARQLARMRGFTAADVPDIEQELVLCVILQLKIFNPQRGNWRAFAATVIDGRAITVIRSRCRAKRGLHRAVVSLEAHRHESDGMPTTVGNLVEPRHLSAVTGRQIPDAFQAVDLRNDLEFAVRSLSADLRYLCYHLQHSQVAEVSRRLRISRTALYRKIERIRVVLRRKNLVTCQKMRTHERCVA